MSKAVQGDTVKVAYTGTLHDGTIFDQTEEGKEISFTIGEKKLIPHFEEAIVDMEPGQTREMTIPCDQAYGTYNDQGVARIQRSVLPEEVTPEVGLRLQVKTEDGTPMIVRITAFDDETVTLDANHPLAGEDLHFSITLKEIV